MWTNTCHAPQSCAFSQYCSDIYIIKNYIIGPTAIPWSIQNGNRALPARRNASMKRKTKTTTDQTRKAREMWRRVALLSPLISSSKPSIIKNQVRLLFFLLLLGWLNWEELWFLLAYMYFHSSIFCFLFVFFFPFFYPTPPTCM